MTDEHDGIDGTDRRQTSLIARRAARGAAAATLVLVALAALALPSGCNILTPAVYLIGGLPTIDAEYVLPPVKTVVFVDDRANVIPSSSRALRLAVASRVTEDLMVREAVLPELMIDPRDAMGLVISRDKHSDPMAIAEIGSEVGAEQIIYIEMLGFSRLREGVSRPMASCRIRVLDVVNSERVFPQPDQMSQRTVQAAVPEPDPIAYRSVSATLKIYRTLADELGEQIARLFYEHESRELGGNLETR